MPADAQRFVDDDKLLLAVSGDAAEWLAKGLPADHEPGDSQYIRDELQDEAEAALAAAKEAEAERQNDAYMEHGQPGGIA
jgi:hypothetical protein